MLSAGLGSRHPKGTGRPVECAIVKTPHPHPYTFSVDEPDFRERVLEASQARPILVDFWADWCSPCHALAPHLDKVVEELGGAVLLAKVEVDEGENMRLAGHYRLRGFPTVLLFHAGEEIGRFSGARPTHWLRDWIDEHVGQWLPEHRAR
jgi:putative thioredoxin